MGHRDDVVGQDISAIARMHALPTLLRTLCDITGMGFSAVARVTETTWTACAVNDGIEFGLEPGGELPLETTLCREVRSARTPIVIAHAAEDAVYKDHHTPRIYGIQSYISVPIVLANGDYFGNLCAIDPNPADVGAPKILAMFTRFADLIASHLDAERSVQTARDELALARESVALQEEFTAILGHDLRNPLAGIVSWTEVLARRSEDLQVARAASRIRASAKRMTALIDDTLDLARGRLAGGLSARLAWVDDLGAGLAGVVDELTQSHPERDVQSHIELAGPIRCDESRVHQLASNLLGNAISHGDANGPVRLSAWTTDGILVVQVWNTGDPIPPESMAMVFKPFWRNAASTEREGLGLGLYICDMIARSHGGTLEVESTVEAGTTFTARMPIAS